MEADLARPSGRETFLVQAQPGWDPVGSDSDDWFSSGSVATQSGTVPTSANRVQVPDLYLLLFHTEFGITRRMNLVQSVFKFLGMALVSFIIVASAFFESLRGVSLLSPGINHPCPPPPMNSQQSNSS